MADADVTLLISAILDGGSIDALTKELASGVAEATTEGGKRSQHQYAQYIKAAVEAGIRDVDDNVAEGILDGMLKDAKEAQKEIAEAWERGDKEHAKFLERQRKLEIKNLTTIEKRRRENYESFSRKQDRDFVERADMFSERMKGGLGGIFGAAGPASFLKNIGAKMREQGDAATHRGKMADASKEERAVGVKGAASSASGAQLMKVGAAMGAIGGIAMMVVALVKAFIALDQKIKDMNKLMVESAGAADFGFGTAREAAVGMSKTLETIRGQILEQAADWEGYRQSSESMFKVLGAMNEMNLTFEEMDKQIKDNTNSIKSFADISIRAVAYGKLLGVEMTQMGQNMATMGNEWGVGLDEIAKGLHMVHKEALLSGFSTKRFYSTILEVTSGLGAYNVRLTEASSLLTMMGAALGQAEGSKAFKALAGEGFQNMDPVEALKAILLRGGPEKVQDIFADEAKAKAEQLFVGMDEAQRKAFGEKFKLDTSSATAFGESFAKAAPAQKAVRDELAKSTYQTVKPEAASAGYAAAGLAKAGKGDLDRMAANMGKLGAASRMRFMMRLPELLGFDNMAQAMEEGNIPELKAALDTIGISMEEFSRSSELVGRLESEFNNLKKESKDVAVGENIDRGKYGTVKNLGGGDFQRVIQDALGNWITQGAVFKDVDTYVGAMNDYVEQETKVIDEDLELGKRIAENTEGLANIIEENIGAILNKIYGVILDIWRWISGDASKRQQLLATRREFQANLAKQREKTETELASAQKQLAGAKTPEQVASAKERVDKATKRGAMLERVAAVANEIDPTEYASAGEYTKAVYARAGIDTGEFEQTEGEGAPPKPIAAPGKGTAKETKRHAALGDALRAAATDRPIITEPTYEGEWDAIEQVFRDLVVEGTSGIRRTQLEDLIAFVRENWLGNAQSGQYETALGNLWDIRHANRWAIGKLEASLNDPSFDWGEIAGAKEEGFGHAEDMYVPSNGRPIALSSSDEILAMKPGGALAQALGGAGGGKGGSPVTINVRGGNPRAVMDAVIKGINIANGKPFA